MNLRMKRKSYEFEKNLLAGGLSGVLSKTITSPFDRQDVLFFSACFNDQVF